MKKQEAAVGENEAEETLDECIARVKAENPEISDEDARAKCTSQPPAEEKGILLTNRGLIAKFTQMQQEMWAKMEDHMTNMAAEQTAKILAKLESDTEAALRKGLGIPKDEPQIPLSLIQEHVRKIMLEESPHGKRTETDTPDKPSAGAEDLATKIVKPADDIFKDLMKTKGAF